MLMQKLQRRQETKTHLVNFQILIQNFFLIIPNSVVYGSELNLKPFSRDPRVKPTFINQDAHCRFV